MTESKVKIHGLKELDKALRGLGAELGAKTLRGALMDAAEPIKQEMLRTAPVSEEERDVKTAKGQIVRIRPGFLKSRIRKRSSLNKRGVTNRKFKKNDVARVRVGVFRVPYVGHYEFGTSKQAANPFIRPALLSKADESLRVFKKRLVRRIELARKKLSKNK